MGSVSRRFFKDYFADPCRRRAACSGVGSPCSKGPGITHRASAQAFMNIGLINMQYMVYASEMWDCGPGPLTLHTTRPKKWRECINFLKKAPIYNKTFINFVQMKNTRMKSKGDCWSGCERGIDFKSKRVIAAGGISAAPAYSWCYSLC